MAKEELSEEQNEILNWIKIKLSIDSKAEKRLSLKRAVVDNIIGLLTQATNIFSISSPHLYLQRSEER